MTRVRGRLAGRALVAAVEVHSYCVHVWRCLVDCLHELAVIQVVPIGNNYPAGVAGARCEGGKRPPPSRAVASRQDVDENVPAFTHKRPCQACLPRTAMSVKLYSLLWYPGAQVPPCLGLYL